MDIDSIKMIPVESTNIRQIGYDPDSRIMLVRFNSGKRYVYENIQGQTFASFSQAPSKGKYFGAVIKPMNLGILDEVYKAQKKGNDGNSSNTNHTSSSQ